VRGRTCQVKSNFIIINHSANTKSSNCEDTTEGRATEMKLNADLASLDVRYHKLSSKLLRELPPLVALPLIPGWVDLRPQDKGVVCRHVENVEEDN